MASSGAAARTPIQVNSSFDHEFHSPREARVEEEFSLEHRPLTPYCQASPASANHGIGGRETTRAPACRGSAVMTRYYFDIRDGQDLYPDADGLDPADQKTAEIEAARA